MSNEVLSTTKWPDRIVIMGAGGFVGGTLAHVLKKKGANVLALTRNHVDLLTPGAAEKLSSLLAPTDCFVAASAVAPCKNTAMLRSNVIMLAAMVEALQISPVAHVVNIGSDAVFADSETPLTEDSTKAPDTPHGVMHLAREVAFASDQSAPLITLRPTLIYGAKDPHNGYGPNRFRRLANEGKTITLFGQGEERRDHVLVDDVAEVAATAIATQATGSLNIASGEVWSFMDIAKMVVEATGTDVAIEGTHRSGPMPHNGYRPFNISRLKATFPELSITPLPDGIKRVQQES
jgi:nucleoside-diphosphate-sugar epimerase